MFQAHAKVEFVHRYIPPRAGWAVLVDLDPSEEGRTGGKRKKVGTLGHLPCSPGHYARTYHHGRA